MIAPATGARALIARGLDLLLPPLCLACDEPVGTKATLCPACWAQTPFIAPPLCACCGTPYELAAADGMLCGACLADPPAFRRARAAMLYDEKSRGLILGFKHGDRTHMTQALALWMARAAADLIAEADLLMPVPLHRWRLWKRRYNQAALLANALGRHSGKPVLPDALRRIRATPTQGHLKKDARRANVKGAFALAPASHDAVRGKKILLIDDVLTTGATVDECARLLVKAGAAHVDVATVARVPSRA